MFYVRFQIRNDMAAGSSTYVRKTGWSVGREGRVVGGCCSAFRGDAASGDVHRGCADNGDGVGGGGRLGVPAVDCCAHICVVAAAGGGHPRGKHTGGRGGLSDDMLGHEACR